MRAAMRAPGNRASNETSMIIGPNRSRRSPASCCGRSRSGNDLADRYDARYRSSASRTSSDVLIRAAAQRRVAGRATRLGPGPLPLVIAVLAR